VSGRGLTRSLLALAGLAAVACGKIGPPVAPELRLPIAPSALSATIDGPAVSLGWTNPDKRVDNSRLRDLATLQVYRREEAAAAEPKAAMLHRGRVVGYADVAVIRVDAPGDAQVSREAAHWVDRGQLVPGHRYVYVVTAVDSTGRSSAPSARLVVDFVAAPGPPRDLAGEAGDASVTLTWKPPSQLIDGSPAAGDLGYLVLRGAGQGDAGPLTAITTEPVTGTEHVDRGLDNDAAYRYAVRAVRLAPGATRALGAPSSEVNVTPVDITPPAAPTELLAIPGPAAIRLAWNASPDADVTRYVVYRAGETGAFARIGSTEPPTTVFVDRDIVAGGVYRYVVTALDTARRPNESARSNEARIRAE
jgi:fibronectin type 3 domain-containing protein